MYCVGGSTGVFGRLKTVPPGASQWYVLPPPLTFGVPAVVVVRDEIADAGFLEFLTRPYRFAYKAGK